MTAIYDEIARLNRRFKFGLLNPVYHFSENLHNLDHHIRGKGLIRIPYCRETWYFVMDLPKARVHLKLNPRGCYRSKDGILRIQMKEMRTPLGSCLSLLKEKFEVGSFPDKLVAIALAWAFVDHVNHIQELGLEEPLKYSKEWLEKIEAKYGLIPRTVTTPTLRIIKPDEYNRIYKGEVKLSDQENIDVSWE